MLQNEVPELIFRSAPLRLGVPLRTPEFAWPAWGISFSDPKEFTKLVQMSEEAYQSEWQETKQLSHDDIRQAAQQAGLGSANQQLNNYLSEVSSKLIQNFEGSTINVLDVGAGTGATTMAIWQRISPHQKKHLFWTLLDPAEEALKEAENSLHQIGIEEHHLSFHKERDLDALPFYHESFDLVVSTAAIHHHAYFESVFAGIAHALKPGGFFVNADWHNSLSTHPAFVHKLLEQLEWPDKKTDLELFRDSYPASRQSPPVLSEQQQQANIQIANFWLAYAQHRKTRISDFMVLEGHRPVFQYLGTMRSVGLIVPKIIPYNKVPNPVFLMPESELLTVIVSQKPQSIESC